MGFLGVFESLLQVALCRDSGFLVISKVNGNFIQGYVRVHALELEGQKHWLQSSFATYTLYVPSLLWFLVSSSFFYVWSLFLKKKCLYLF